MNNRQLITMLRKHPLDAEVLIYDTDANKLERITGCVGGPNSLLDKYTIELCSDTMGG